MYSSEMWKSNRLCLFFAALLGYISLLFIVLVTFPWRGLVWVLARVCIPRFQGFVTGFDQSYCNFVGDDWAPNTILTVFTIQGDLRVEIYRDRMRSKFIDKLDPTGRFVNTRFRQTFKWFLGYRVWVDVEKYVLNDHIYAWEGTGHKEIVDERSLKKCLQLIMDRPWRKEESPWEAIIVNGYERKKDQSLLILRSQHALGDGTFWASTVQDFDGKPWKGHVSPAFMKLFKEPSTQSLTQSQIGFLSYKRHQLVNLSYLLMRIMIDTGSYFATKKHVIDRNSDVIQFWQCLDNQNNSLTKSTHYVNFSASYRMEMIKKIRRRFQVGFNSVLFSVVGGSVRKLMLEVQGKCPQRLPICLALPKFCHPGLMVNHFLCGTCDLPLEPASAAERLRRTDQVISSFKDCYAPVGLDYLFTICGLMPGMLRDLCCRSFVNPGVLFSSFPVLGKGATIDNFLLSDMMGCHGSTRNDLGLSVVAAGCENRVIFSFVMESTVDLPSIVIKRLEDFIRQELQELLGARI